jgi:hypothetical protein
LGRSAFALAIRELLLGAKTPFAMSISGRWGAGKTSIDFFQNYKYIIVE